MFILFCDRKSPFHCSNLRFSAKLNIYSLLSRCSRGSSSRFSLVSPTKVKTCKPFLFTENVPLDVSEVNRERSRLAAVSSVCDLTKHIGLVTLT